MGSQLNPSKRRAKKKMAAAASFALLSSARTAAAFSFRRSAVSAASAQPSATATGAFLFRHAASDRRSNAWASLSMSTAADATETKAEAGHDPKYDRTNKAAGIDGSYNPSAFESKIYDWWEQEGCFQPDAKQSQGESEAAGRKPYTLPMPPPNVTGRLHMGHAIFVALQDILARFHRMRGRPVLWLPGEWSDCVRVMDNCCMQSSCHLLTTFLSISSERQFQNPHRHRNRPRRNCHTASGRKGPYRRGYHPGRGGPRGIPSPHVGVQRGAGRPHHTAAPLSRCQRRLVTRALYHGRRKQRVRCGGVRSPP